MRRFSSILMPIAVGAAALGLTTTDAGAQAAYDTTLYNALSWRMIGPYRGGRSVAEGALGAEDVLLLPPGDYELQVDSEPPYRAQVQVEPEQSLTLVLERKRGSVLHSGSRRPAEYVSCEQSPYPHTARPAAQRPAPPAARRPAPAPARPYR